MTSPMRAPTLHDQLVLLPLGEAKRWAVPGISRVQITLAANLDTQATPGEGKSATQLNEATGEVQVDVQMWTHEQWTQYQHLLWLLRRGTKDGPAVFTSVHPEIKARRIKRMYFVSESVQPYSPRDGYRVTLKFSEKLKDKTSATPLGGEQLVIPSATTGSGSTPLVTGTASTAQGRAVQQAAISTLSSPPAPADGGRANTATPGYCSAWARVAGTKAGLSSGLFGASALATEGNFKRAGLSVPWTADTMRTLEPGDFVFWANDPSGFGHVGIVVGRDKDGMPLIAGNNQITAKSQSDARGIVRLDQLSSNTSQPTSVGKPGGVPKGPAVQGPAAPVGPPSFAPSQNVRGP